MIFGKLVAGFLAKIITGLDDTITHAPIIASITRTKHGRLAFGLGMFFAIIAVIILANLAASFLEMLPFRHIIAAVVLLLLAAAIHFDLLVHIPRTKAEKRLFEEKRISEERFRKLMGIGFIAFFATAIDDAIVYAPLLVGTFWESSFVMLGILIAAICELVFVLHFAERISLWRYKSEFTSAGLVILAGLVFFRVL